MTLKDLRVIAAGALFGFLFLFFVPLIYDATMFQCRRTCGGFDCGLCPSDTSGWKSIGYSLFHWGGYYSSGAGGPGYGIAGTFVLSNGSTLTTSGILVLFALPLAIIGAGLLEPEIVRKFRAAAIGFVVLAMLDFLVAANSFSLAYIDRALSFDLLGAVLSLTGVVMILHLYVAGYFVRQVQASERC